MAITPRVLFTQPATAAVAAVTILGLSVLASSAVENLRTEEAQRSYTSPCADLIETLGPQTTWSEAGWLRYTHCFDLREDSAGAASAALQGLRHYPESELLHSVAGYHLIETGAYSQAVRTLENGLAQLPGPSASGVMENNLAWAYLWVGDGDSDLARGLYQSSLRQSPRVCETLHTGLMVEFEHARNTVGLERAESLKLYQTLRTRYGACEHREETWENLVETTGVGVLDVAVEEMLDRGFAPAGVNQTLRVSTERLANDYGVELAGALCAKGIPMSDLRDDCVRSVLTGR